MQQRRFRVTKARRDISRDSEIRILVYGARNESRDLSNLFLVCAEDMWESGGECSGGLDGNKVRFAHGIAVIETEYSFRLVQRNGPAYFDHVLVKGAAHELEVAE